MVGAKEVVSVCCTSSSTVESIGTSSSGTGVALSVNNEIIIKFVIEFVLQSYLLQFLGCLHRLRSIEYN